MKRIAKYLVVVVFLTLFTVIAHGQDRNSFPTEFKNNYLSSCYENGNRDGVSQSYTKTFCNCSIQTLERNYSFQEFMALDRKRRSGQDPTSDPKFQVVLSQMKTCKELAQKTR